MRTSPMLFIFLLLAGPLSAELGERPKPRTWTASDGRTLEAEVVSVSDTGVRIRRTSDGRQMDLTMEMLSKEDQEHVKSLQAADANKEANMEAEVKRNTGLKEGPYAEFITGEFVRTKTAGGMPFQLYGPENAKGTKRYPLVLALHGGGSRGGDTDWPAGSAAEVWTKGDFGDENPCFVVAPRCAENVSWVGGQGDKAAALVKDLAANLPIDLNRIYVTGGSLGGGGSWYQIAEHQELYAGTLILCNAGFLDTIEKTKHFPIWQFHGEKDPDHPVEKARDMAKEMAGAKATKYKFTELPGEGHIIHPTVYGNEEALKWLFSQNKAGAPTEEKK